MIVFADAYFFLLVKVHLSIIAYKVLNDFNIVRFEIRKVVWQRHTRFLLELFNNFIDPKVNDIDHLKLL